MKILEFKELTDLDNQKQVDQAILLYFFHHKNTGESQFDINTLNMLFSDAGYKSINVSRVRKALIDNRKIRFIKGSRTVYEFIPSVYQSLESQLGQAWNDNITIDSNSELIDESKFCGKRNYLDRLIQQINFTYKNNCYDACAVLMRRLFEILLVVSYQNHKIDDHIKEMGGAGYIMLDGIVKDAIQNKTLNLSRNRLKYDDFRKVGNFSAHNITYTAGIKDIDDIKLEYRVMVEELYNKAGLIK